MYDRRLSVFPIHNLPAHNRSHNFPRKLPPTKRSIARQRPRLGGLKCPTLFRVEYGYIAKVSALQRSAPAKIEDARRASGKEFDDARQRNLVLAVQLRYSKRQRRFESSNAEGSALELDLLFM